MRPKSGRMRVGIPRAMSMLEQYPFWQRYSREFGIATGALAGDRSAHRARAGLKWPWRSPVIQSRWRMATCVRLSDTGVDYMLVPNVLDAESEPGSTTPAHYCPWNQTLPYVLRAAPGWSEYRRAHADADLAFPTRSGAGQNGSGRDHGPALGVSRRASDAAVDAAYRRATGVSGEARLRQATGTENAGRKRRARPDPGGTRLQHIRPRHQLRHPTQAAASLWRQRDPSRFPGDWARVHRRPAREHVLGVGPQDPGGGAHRCSAARICTWSTSSNFKCGPDSYIKHFTRQAAGAPLLVLQFDGHGNDAGYMTRCEAYLDSKGILRCYKPSPTCRYQADSRTVH